MSWVMRAFVRALRQGKSEPLTSARASLESHLLAFAAEKARVEGARHGCLSSAGGGRGLI